MLQEHARYLLVIHALLGVAVVGASTHLVVWLRGYLRGKPQRKRSVVRFAWISTILFGLTFLVGNLAYPIYKINVRNAYLDNPAAIAHEHSSRDQAIEFAEEAARVARWFDVKEHWTALGFALTIGCLLILRRWDPGQARTAITSSVFAMAAIAAATTWLAAIVGLVTSSYRAIG